MALTLTSLADLASQGFDDIIDVRAPAEFAEDHLPGALFLDTNWLEKASDWNRRSPEELDLAVAGDLRIADQVEHVIDDLERQTQINEDVIRYMTIRVDAQEEGPSVMMRKQERERRGGVDRRVVGVRHRVWPLDGEHPDWRHHCP